MVVDKSTMVPPEELNIQFGAGNYLAAGDEARRLFREKFGLTPQSRVLDVGCGAGRVAIGLVDYLEPPGEYHGFDTYPFGIDWCNERIAPHYPHFHFNLCDVHNDTYNPFSRVKASEYVFPHEDDYFDVVVLRSVFTHMFPDQIVNYTDEIARVLRPGGHALITFFLLNEDSRQWQKRTGKGPAFKKFGLFHTEFIEDPLDCVGYDEPFVQRLVDGAGLEIIETLYGSWCGRKGPGAQDSLLLRKPGPAAEHP